MIKKYAKILIFIICFNFHFFNYVICVDYGDDLANIAHTTISGKSVDNHIREKASMYSGFSLADADTTCSFDSLFPVSGIVDLNGGRLDLIRTLVLEKDFIFVAVINWATLSAR